MDRYADTPRTSSEELLRRKKKQIVDKSMALFTARLDQWADQTLSDEEALSGVPMVHSNKRGAKRAREDSCEVEDDASSRGESVGPSAAAAAASKNKKRAKHALLACPFCKHDPARYKNVKTCMGPGWVSLHRVK